MREDYTIEKFEKDVSLKNILENYVDYTKTEHACRKCRCHSNNWTCPPFYESQTNIWTKFDNIKFCLNLILQII